jgi:hypothetical protein
MVHKMVEWAHIYPLEFFAEKMGIQHQSLAERV